MKNMEDRHMRLRKLGRVILALAVTAALGVGLPLGSAGVAFAADFGNVQGNVSDAVTQAPLSGARVMLFDAATFEPGISAPVAESAPTGASGNYLIFEAPAGDYIIVAQAPGYISEYYPEATSPGDAVPQSLTAAGLADVSFTLELGGAISGMVWNDWGGTEQNQVVAVWTADTLEMVAWAFSNEWDWHGHYEVNDLPFGDYKVSAGGPLPEGVQDPGNRSDNLMRGWWSQQGTVPSPGEADVITVDDPTPVEGIDFWLQQGGRIEGRIVDENWNKLDGATVTLEDYDTGTVVATTLSYNRDGMDPGYYNFSGLSSAIDYRVWATAPGRVIRYAQEHTSGTYDRSQATRYQLGPGDNRWLNDISLPYGGSLSGSVRDAAGAGIPGAVVTVQSWAETGGDSWVRVETTADGSGDYSVPGIPPGGYRVSALANGFAVEYYAAGGSVVDPEQAEEVTVTPGPVDGINFALDPGGTISGAVYNQNQQPLVGAKVMAVPAEMDIRMGGGDDGPGFDSPFVSETDATGAYSIIGLPFDDYKVLANGGANPQYVREWYDDQLLFENATAIPVADGAADVVGIDFTLALGGSITGVVTPDGGDQWLNDPRVVVFDYNTGRLVDTVGTLEDGMTYHVQGLPAGSYRVMARAWNRARVFWQDTFSWAEATPVDVTAPGVTASINFALPPGGQIGGRVWVNSPGGSGPLPGAIVTAYMLNPLDTADEMFEDMVFTAVADDNGEWQIDFVPFGDYKLGARGGEGQVVIPKWWSEFGDARTWDEAGVRRIDEFNQQWWTDFWLDPAGLVTGSVFQEDTTTPIEGAAVFALDPWFDPTSTKSHPSPHMRPADGGDGILGATLTEADGSYELYVPADQGHFVVGAQAEGRVRKFFQDTFDPMEAMEFELSAGEEIGGINFNLGSAGTIAGVVYDAATGGGLAGCVVHAFDESTGIDFKTGADENGAYTIDNLPYGTYIVMAMGMPEDAVTANYAMEWWQEAASHDAATPVAVAAATPDVGGIDFTLEPGGAIEGMVWHEHGWDINGARVDLYLPDGTLLATTWSNGWEGYQFRGVPSGTYYVSAWFIDPQGNSNTQRIFYDNQRSFAEANPVVVNAPNIVSDINFTLPQAQGRISGLIIYSGTFQPADYDQVVVAAQPTGSDGQEQSGYATSLGDLGTYEIHNIADGTYIVIAWLDVDGDMQPDPGEPYGFYGDPTPVVIESTLENPQPHIPGTTVIITDEAKGIILGGVSVEGAADNSGATVTAGTYQTTTNAEGTYILNVEPGTYSVTITRDGYLAAVSPEVYVMDVLSGEPTEMPDVLLLLGDVNADSSIDVEDLVAVADSFGTAGPAGDLTGDGVVDIQDLTAIGRNFGATESPWLGASLPDGYRLSTATAVILSPASQEAAPGESVGVGAVIKDAAGVYGAEFHMAFDATLLQALDTDASLAGNQIAPSDEFFPFVAGAYYSDGGVDLYHYSYSAAGGGYFIAQCQADNTLGTIDYAIVLLAPASGADNSVTADSAGAAVATATFDTLDEGEAGIDFSAAPKLAAGTGAPMPVDSFAGATITLQIPPPEISDIVISNVGDKSFSVSWVTNVNTTGNVNWGTSQDSLTSVAYDDRVAATEDDTHHVTVESLAANTTYYFDVVSAQTTDDNAGAHYQVTTGPSLTFTMPEMVSGMAYQMDGTTPAEGAIVYVRIGTASSQILSGLTDASGTWALDIAPARADDFQTYYAHTDNDDLVVDGQGSAQGTGSVSTTIGTAKVGAPDLVLVPNWAPTVENVTASQDTGTGTVSIAYDVSDQDEDDTSADVSLAFWNGTTYVACTTVTGDGSKTVSTSATRYTATWDAKTDFDGQYLTDAKIKVIANDGNIAGAGEGISTDFSLDTRGPTGVEPGLPADGATGVGLSPTFTTIAVTDPSGPVAYNFVVARDASFSVGVQESGWLSTTSWVPTVRLQAPEVDHWWKVKARDAFGNVSESTVYSLTTLAVIPVDVNLVDGWNIIALAVEPTGDFTASTLAADINAQGGAISQVFWWNAAAGNWDFYLVDAQYGTDFGIQIGHGYLLKNAGTATWTYWGVPPTSAYSATVEPRVSNVADKSFTVSWISQSAEQGQVNWGTDPAALDQTAEDDRGAATLNDTHHVTISGLTADTAYFFTVASGGVTYDDGGTPFEVTTGPSLAFTMPEMVSGQVFKADGTTLAEGAIVYAQIGTSSSQVLSGLTDASGTWALDIAPARATDFQGYYAHADEDDLSCQIQGAADGSRSDVVTIATAKAGAPAVNVSLSAEVVLVDGWNLIALPIDPATSYTASTMAAEINGQGGGVSQVFWWNAAAGSWDFYLVDAEYGTDFDIEMGEGYLLNNSTPVNWQVPGN